MCEGGRGGRGRRRGQPAEDPKGQTDRAGQDAGGRHEQSERNAMFLRTAKGPGTKTSLTHGDRSSTQAWVAPLCPGGQSSSIIIIIIIIIYAQVDKSKKSKPQSPTTTNYTNLDFANSLSLYENSRDVLSRLQGPPPLRAQEVRRSGQDQRQEYRNPDPSLPISPTRRQTVGVPPSSLVLHPTTENYLDMSPSRRAEISVTDYELMQFRQRRTSETVAATNGESPLIGFSPVNPLCESVESMVIMYDESKFNTIKQMPKNGVKADEDSVLMSQSCQGDIPSQEASGKTPPSSPLLLNILPNSAFCSGYVTIPRSR